MKKITSTLLLLSLIALSNIKAENFNHIQKETISETDSYDRVKNFINTVSENKKAVLATGLIVGLVTAKPIYNASDKISRVRGFIKKGKNKITGTVEYKKHNWIYNLGTYIQKKGD